MLNCLAHTKASQKVLLYLIKNNISLCRLKWFITEYLYIVTWMHCSTLKNKVDLVNITVATNLDK